MAGTLGPDPLVFIFRAVQRSGKMNRWVVVLVFFCFSNFSNLQEKLPKSNRRPVPQAPENFDKVISGEIKGKDLIKMNQKAFDDYNETSLQSCQWCGR